MPPKAKPHIATKCTESIAALHLLHYVPAQPSSNSVTSIQSREAGYSIPFEDERRLASTLAFLSCIENDPDHIPAVCIHSTRNEKFLKVLLAVNRKGGLAEGWKQYASDVKRGFDRIAAILKHANDLSRDTEQKVFTEIIQLCKSRILDRLRFQRKKKGRQKSKEGTTIAGGLKPVVDYLHNSPSKNEKLFLERARQVLRLASSWTKHSTDQELENLVDAINSLRQTEEFEAILEAAFRREPNLQVRFYLSNMIRKVSRYREAARILRRLARKSSQVRQMQIVIVELPTEAFKRPTTDSNYRASIQSTISRVQNLKGRLKDVNQICKLLQLSRVEANGQFDDKFKDISKNSKVHAEIQLLYYCETTLQGKPLPRVICSSKSACWLCNDFILMHGKIHTPRSHGRLYPGWRLPNIIQSEWCSDIAARFNQRLENKIAESLKTLHARKKQTNYPEPIESELSVVTWLSLPIQPKGRLLSNNVTGGKKTKQLETVSLHDSPKQSVLVTVVEKSKAPSEERSSIDDAELETLAGNENTSPIVLAAVVSISSGSPVDVCTASADTSPIPQESPIATQGSSATTSTETKTPNEPSPRRSASPVSPDAEPSTGFARNTSTASSAPPESATQQQARTYSVARGEISSVYKSGPLKLQFEYAGKRNHQIQGEGSSCKQLSCTAEWLSSGDIEQLKTRGVIAINLDTVTAEEIAYKTDDENNMYLRHEEGVLRLKMRPA
ncbi:hypothetical protein F5B22DRAFT_597516 [Xylaria bambusicola]|uniref:uncharacterized protein n=1 Tax=Xylaria bambusicola TaxID=326684 RepID=UPI002007EFDA|nr:uncharacterized protein F5B22DRAFT_597516 [Xylaria bambusicola]KAI0521065.1 hypothetical protein F5B22DRAFT_597516 [Xylaria bambusicola]